MSYLKMYKKRVGLGANSHKEFTINEMERNFKEYLRTSPTSVTIPMTEPDEIAITEKTNKVQCIINDLTVNDKKAYDEKKVLVSKETNVDVGCYFFWDNCYWLIIYKEHKAINTYKKFIATRCNQILRYKYKGIVYDIPINIANLTMYSDGLADLKYTSQQDSKRMITFGSNPITRTIKPNTRIMLTRKTVFRVTHLNDFEYNGDHTGADGIIKTLVLQTTLLEKDDLKNNIAWNEDIETVYKPEPLKICGDKTIMIGSKKKYTVENMTSDYTFMLSDNNNLDILVKSEIQEDGILSVEVSRNVNHTGESFNIKLIDINSNEVVDIKKVTIVGLL